MLDIRAWKVLSLQYAEWYKIITLTLSGTQNELYAGTFCTTDIHPGLHEYYISGYVDGYLHGKFGKGARMATAIAFDFVPPIDISRQAIRSLPLKECVSRGIIHIDSMIAKIMKKYELNYAIVTGSVISGPSVEMILALENHKDLVKNSKVLDLFAGGGSLGIVCLALGARRVVAIEQGLRRPKTRIHYMRRIQFVRGDVFEISFKNMQFDLVLVDPYYSMTNRVLLKLLPKIIHIARYGIINLGRLYRPGSLEWVVNKFREIVPNGQLLVIGTAAIGIWKRDYAN